VLPFKKLYIDSSIFIGEGWPDISAQLDELISLSRVLKVPLVLLQPVERELEAHWMRDCDKAVQRIESVSSNLNALLRRVSQGIEPQLPDRKEIRVAYRRRVDEVVRLGLERAEVELRSVSELFGMAVWQMRPFQEEGKGFQDTVICLAAIDHFARSLPKETESSSEKRGFEGVRSSESVTERTVAFVTKDRDFEEESVVRLAKAKGVNLILYRSLDDAHKVLVGQLEEKVKQLWQQDRTAAAEAARREKDRLEEFINRNLEIPQQQVIFFGEILRVNRVSFVEVLEAYTPFPFKRELPFNFAVDINVSIFVTVRPAAFLFPPPSPKLKVGAEPSVVDNPFFAAATSTEPKEQILERTLEVGLRAYDSKYDQIEPISLKLK
jgi:PIN domain